MAARRWRYIKIKNYCAYFVKAQLAITLEKKLLLKLAFENPSLKFVPCFHLPALLVERSEVGAGWEQRIASAGGLNSAKSLTCSSPKSTSTLEKDVQGIISWSRSWLTLEHGQFAGDFAEWLEFLKCGRSIHHGETLQIVFLKILEFELFLHFSRMGYRWCPAVVKQPGAWSF